MNGADLVKLRKEAGLTQKKLGELLEVTRKTISEWERGKRNLSYMNEVAIRKTIEDSIGFRFEES